MRRDCGSDVGKLEQTFCFVSLMLAYPHLDRLSVVTEVLYTLTAILASSSV